MLPGAVLLALPVPATIGTTLAVTRTATIATPPGAARAAKATAPVHMGDVVATGAKSAVRIQFVDSTFFSLGANARVTIDRFAYDPERDASSMSLNFTKGAFRFVSGKPTHAEPGQKAIVTPAATIGIRGTTVTGIIGPEALAYYGQADAAVLTDGGDASTATLILLSDAGEAGGGIDVEGSGVLTELREPGQALFFRRAGEPPRPPRMLPPQVRGRLERQAAPQGLGREPRGGQQGQRGQQGQQGQRGGQQGAGQPGQPNGPNSSPGGMPGSPPGGGPPR